MWDQLNPPVTEESLQGKFFAVVFYDIKRKPHLYVGRILKRFLTNADGPAKEFSVECLKRGATSTSTVLEEVPQHLNKDIAIYPTYDIICGPLKASLLRGAKWSVPDYPLVYTTIEIVNSLPRIKKYEQLFIKN